MYLIGLSLEANSQQLRPLPPDKAEADSQANAVLSTAAVKIDGSSRIKKQLGLFNHAFTESKLVGEPKYNKA